ncbi:hypothetical protein AB0L74_28830 [Streptomyces sp. NPDC052020]|uniref:hypothetical protein n=1 Tax=Streptomyces sp. NPDC052020 TaxID=3155677 RepID=UPI003421C4FB
MSAVHTIAPPPVGTRTLSGPGRTARGPVTPATEGRVIVDGVTEPPGGARAFAPRCLQARQRGLLGRPFPASGAAEARWWPRPLGSRDRRFLPEADGEGGV